MVLGRFEVEKQLVAQGQCAAPVRLVEQEQVEGDYWGLLQRGWTGFHSHSLPLASWAQEADSYFSQIAHLPFSIVHNFWGKWYRRPFHTHMLCQGVHLGYDFEILFLLGQPMGDQASFLVSFLPMLYLLVQMVCV